MGNCVFPVKTEQLAITLLTSHGETLNCVVSVCIMLHMFSVCDAKCHANNTSSYILCSVCILRSVCVFSVFSVHRYLLFEFRVV